MRRKKENKDLNRRPKSKVRWKGTNEWGWEYLDIDKLWFFNIEAPILQINDEDNEDELCVSDKEQLDCSNNDENDDNNYLYHLTNVLPGVVW